MTKNNIIDILQDMKEHHVYMNTILEGTLETLWEIKDDKLSPFGIEKIERFLEAIETRREEMVLNIDMIKNGIKEHQSPLN